MGEFTITNNGLEQTLSDWGLDDARRERQSVGEHTVQLLANGRAIDAADLFEYGSTVIIYRDREQGLGGWTGGSRWFYGRVEPWEGEGRPSEENCTGQLINPWWYLKELVFEQVFKIWGGYNTPNDPSSGVKLIDFNNPHTFLNQAIDRVAHPNGRLNVADQVREALNWAISKGAPIQIGTLEPDITPPVDEVRGNILCAGVLEREWHWCPDAIFDWDYSTEPYPTIHMRRADGLPAIAVNLNGGRPLNSIKLKQRRDWVRPFVRIVYEQTNDGILSCIEDVYPNPLPTEPEKQFGGFTTTVGLNGGQVTRQTATLAVQAINGASIDWWKARKPALADTKSIDPATVTDTSLSSVKITGIDADYDPSLAYELIEGSQPPQWLIDQGVSFMRVQVTANIKYSKRNGTTPVAEVLSHECTATNSAGGSYFTSQVDAVPEPVPMGLAASLYRSFQAIAVEGSLTNIDEEVSSQFDTWKVLNFTTPLRPEWASVRALPRRISDSLKSGTTSIEFGAPEFLTAGELVELLRVARGVLMVSSFGTRSGGQAGSVSVDLGKKSVRANSTDGAGYHETFTASGSADPKSETDPAKKGLITMDGPGKGVTVAGHPTDGTIALYLKDLKDATNKEFKIRRLQFRDADNGCALMQCWVAMTEPEAVTP